MTERTIGANLLWLQPLTSFSSPCFPLAYVTRSSLLSSLRATTQRLTDRAHVPFSETPVAAALLLDDGAWIPGVRVESASYSLTLPALLNAYSTAVALNRAADVIAFVLSRPFRREESLYVEELPHGPYEAWADDAWLRADAPRNAPAPVRILSPVLETFIDTEADGIRATRRLFDTAYVPSSHFPVAAILETDDDNLLPGVNVEHPDWSRTLCAERNALGTMLSYAAGNVHRLFLSCKHDEEGTPCGACRQLLAELAPESILWMDRHDDPPEHTTVSALLPNSFRGRARLNDP